MPVHHQEKQEVAYAVAVVLGGGEQPVDLGGVQEVFARSWASVTALLFTFRRLAMLLAPPNSLGF